MQRLWRLIATYGGARLSAPEERRLAGRISGALWVSGAATLLLMLAVPGERIEHIAVVVLVAALAVAWGAALLLLVPWERAPRRLFHISSALVLIVVALLQPLTGGEASPAHEYLWFVVVYAAFFFTPWPLVAYVLGASVVSALPLLYDTGAVEGNLARELLIVAPLFALVGAILFAGRELLEGLSRQAAALLREHRRIAEEQSSLRRVATAVAAGSPPEAIFALVSSEVGRLLGADAASIGRYVGDRRLHVMGVWQGRTETGTIIEVEPTTSLRACAPPGRPSGSTATAPAPTAAPTASATARSSARRCTPAARSGACSSPARGARARSRRASRSACATTRSSSRRPSPTPRTARGSTSRRASTISPACRTTAPSATASRTRSAARGATAARSRSPSSTSTATGS
jgi:hypothetical protein